MSVLTPESEVPEVVEPSTIGPTWKRGPDRRFVLPEYTLGWHALAWTSTYLQHYVGKPWRYTPEQARLTLWWYALDPATNRFLWRDGVIQRLKGWGLRQGPAHRDLVGLRVRGPLPFRRGRG